MTAYIVDYSNLLPGDIVLSAERALPSKAIRAATASRYSHAAIWIGGSLIQATLDGVLSANPQRVHFAQPADAMVYRSRTPLTEHQSALICNYARSCVGSLYALSELALLPLGRFKKIGMPATKRQFCSRLVAMAYAHAGYELNKRISPEFCTPRMISLSPKLQAVPAMIRPANLEELAIAASPDGIRLNKEQLFKWINGIRSIVEADPYLRDMFDIQSDGDVYELLLAHPELDGQATSLLRESGYLSFYSYDATVERNAYRYDKSAMDEALREKDPAVLLHSELDKEPRMFDRFDSMRISMSTYYRDTKLEFFRELVMLYRNLLHVVGVRLDVIAYGFERIGDVAVAERVRQLLALTERAIREADEVCAAPAAN